MTNEKKSIPFKIKLSLEFKVLGTYAEPTNAKNLFEIKLKSLLEWAFTGFYAFMRSGRRILSSSFFITLQISHKFP